MTDSKVKMEFLRYPIDHSCTSIMSIGPPGSGKTHIALGCLRWWIENKTFDEYHLVLPAFKNEQNDSYAFLNKYLNKNVFIYETYSTTMAEKLVAKSVKSNELFKQGKIKQKPYFFFMCDDATSQTALFDSPPIARAVTENRHLQIHSWFLMHQDKKVVNRKVRENFKFFFIYPLHPQKLKYIYEEYVNFPLSFVNFKDFMEFWKEYILQKEHGVMFIFDRFYFAPHADTWFV